MGESVAAGARNFGGLGCHAQASGDSPDVEAGECAALRSGPAIDELRSRLPARRKSRDRYPGRFAHQAQSLHRARGLLEAGAKRSDGPFQRRCYSF